MRRGEVWWVDFRGTIDGEPQKTRPAVLLSTDSNNSRLNRIQIIPLTGNTSRVYPWEAIVTVNGRKLKAIANSVTTVAKSRVSNREGALSAPDLQLVDAAVRVQLGL